MRRGGQSVWVVGCFVACALSSGGCGASTDEGTTDSTTSEELSAKAPIPYVLQWVGRYDGDGSGDVETITLRRTGTFAAKINGTVHTGRFMGPGKPGQWPLVIAFVSKGDYFTGTIDQWADGTGHAVMKIKHGASVHTVTAPWLAPSESACDATKGAWTDDDVDPTTGLYCVCPAGDHWVPSAGGCVR